MQFRSGLNILCFPVSRPRIQKKKGNENVTTYSMKPKKEKQKTAEPFIDVTLTTTRIFNLLL